MTECPAVPLAALIASTLSFCSGFGLGTLLMPKRRNLLLGSAMAIGVAILVTAGVSF